MSNLRRKASNLTETRISHEQKIHTYQLVKWCPGAESNHRHEDFQSTALPLSYPGTGEAAGRLGGVYLDARARGVQRDWKEIQWGLPR